MNAGSKHDGPNRSGDASWPSDNTARQVSVLNDRLDSRDLFVGTRAIVILHGDDAYHLRLTSQNKLILTK